MRRILLCLSLATMDLRSKFGVVVEWQVDDKLNSVVISEDAQK